MSRAEVSSCDPPALAQEKGPDVSDAGDLLELTAVCAGGTQLLTSARDM